jgi:hypothetical protein
MATEEEVQAAFEAATKAIADVAANDLPLLKGSEKANARAVTIHAQDQAKATALAGFELIRRERNQAAEIIYAADPVNDIGRLADLTESQMLANGKGKVQAQNLLLPRAWQLLGLGQIEKAAVVAHAAEIAGAVEINGITISQLKQAIEDERDQKYPNRIEAIGQLKAADKAYVQRWVAVQVADAHIQTALGRSEQLAMARIAVKAREALEAHIEARPIRSDIDLGLPANPDHSLKWKPGMNTQLDSHLRGVETRTPTDAEGRAK